MLDSQNYFLISRDAGLKTGTTGTTLIISHRAQRHFKSAHFYPQ